MYSTVNLNDKPLDKLIVELEHPFCYEVRDDQSDEFPGTSSSMKPYIYKKWGVCQ
jgi:hypothetical protein